ncbi:MAG: ribonuclease HII [Bacteroidia bacterium]|nr:ribonuclease HII [Bacteroidia bacterium]NNL34110.1 ribonuclease HII [Flavobacteriaceae bacterium]
MKKIVTALLLVFIVGCNKSNKGSAKLSDFIPENSSVIIKIHDLETFKTDFNSSDLSSRFSNLSPFHVLEEEFESFDLLQTKLPILLTIQRDNDGLNYRLITKLTDSLFSGQSFDSIKAPYKIIDSVLIASNSERLLTNLMPKPRPDIESLLATAKSDKSFSLITSPNNSQILGRAFLTGESLQFSEQSFIDASIAPEQISLNGITMTNDSTFQLASIFKDNIPQENTIQHIAPSNAKGFISFTFNDFQNIYTNLENYRDTATDSILNFELFETLNEVAEIYYENTSLVALKSIDAAATKEALRGHQDVVNTYRSVDILKFGDPAIFNTIFSPLIKSKNVTKYVVIDDFFVFSNSEDALFNIIANFQNGTTFANNDAYNSCMSELSDESSLLVVADAERLKETLSKIFEKEAKEFNTKDYKLSAIQMVQDDGYAHINGIIKKHKRKAILNKINELFSVTLDADIIMEPQFVINHRTKEKEIVVQDVNNNLYLISNTGKILWKKRLIGAIQGKIEQVDLYRNGRLQLAFATPVRVYVIDRNGKNVGPFPLKFGERITQPLSVFDYDKTRNYRFLVTQGTDLLMYDRNGRFVKGFKYMNRSVVKTQPKHIRVGSKDYIVFGAGKKLQIINRQGSTRVNVRTAIDFSGQDIYFYNNGLATTTANGELIQVKLNGAVTKTALNLNSDHFIDATAKTLVTLSENILSIKDKSIELDFGNYTPPKIFYINDKIYVSLTDLQSQKIYLFDSQAKSIPHFPVYGNSTIDLENIDGDSNLEFVAKGDSNSIVVYKKN